MIERLFSVLTSKIRVTTDCDELKQGLDDIASGVPSERPDGGSLTFHIYRRESGPYVIVENNEAMVECADPQWTLVHLHHRIMNRVCARMHGTLMIHGGLGARNGKRFILCGEKGTGKTTLLCRLLFDGVQGHSDDIVFLNDQGATPFPGKFRLKEGTLALVPQLKPACGRLMSYPDFSGERVYFFDPRDAGFERAVTIGKVDLFVYLVPDRSEKTEMVPCPKFMMVQKIMGLTLNLEHDPRSQIRSLCRAVNAGSCYTLRVNGLEKAVEMIREVLH